MSNESIFKYKGYSGSVECNLDDKCLFGKILFIDDLVLYEGNTVEELEVSFKEAVDDYLKTCKEIGKEPQKAYSGSFNVRVKPEVHRTLVEKALGKGISLNELVKDAFEYYISL